MDEQSQSTQKTNNLFFEELKNSGFFPQSPEIILIQNAINLGNQQDIQIPDASGTQQQSGVAAQDLEKQQPNVVEQPTQQSKIQTTNTPDLEQPKQPQIQVPEIPATQQQSSTAVQDLEQPATQQQQPPANKAQIQVPEIPLVQQPQIQISEIPATQQQSSTAVQDLENKIAPNEQNNEIKPLPINQNQTTSLSAAENKIRDLDQKSKADEITPAPIAPPEPLQQSEAPVVMNNSNSTTSVNTIEPDYTKIIMEKYKSPPNWHYMMG